MGVPNGYMTIQTWPDIGWHFIYAGRLYSRLPTAQGVFSRDARDNKVSLSGFQRVTNFHEASWYQREAPRIIGTKASSWGWL